jgi:putative PIN family toxin of toxin-antitoxin system
MRVVIDTNVIVSGLMKTASTPAAVLSAARGRQFEWIASGVLLSELQNVLARPRVQRQTGLDLVDALHFQQIAEDLMTLVEPTHRIDASRDPDDNRVLEAAIAGEADYIVTGDRDLLELGSYEGIRIVTPAGFVALLPR